MEVNLDNNSNNERTVAEDNKTLTSANLLNDSINVEDSSSSADSIDTGSNILNLLALQDNASSFDKGHSANTEIATRETLESPEQQEKKDRPAETLIEIIKDSKQVQAKVTQITEHMDKADEKLKELHGSDGTDATKDSLLKEALQSFDRAAEIVKPDQIETIRKQRRILEQEIKKEQEKENKDLKKLKSLKIMERNLYVLERAPGFTRGNQALALYKAGKTAPEAKHGNKSLAQVALAKAFESDPVLRSGSDPNFWNQARKLENANPELKIQEDASILMADLKESEMKHRSRPSASDQNTNSNTEINNRTQAQEKGKEVTAEKEPDKTTEREEPGSRPVQASTTVLEGNREKTTDSPKADNQPHDSQPVEEEVATNSTLKVEENQNPAAQSNKETIETKDRTTTTEATQEVSKPQEQQSIESEKPDYSKMTQQELMQTITKLSMKPVKREIPLKTGETRLIDWQEFDPEKARENLPEYKAAFQELLKRADNPSDLQGNSYSFEQWKEIVEIRTKSLDAGVDLTQPGKTVVDANGNESIQYPTLDPTRRIELHTEVVSVLKVLSYPVTLRMEYAMRMESLGQRKDASNAYQEAFKKLEELPQDLINAEKNLLNTDEARLVGEFVNPSNSNETNAVNAITKLKEMVNGADGFGNRVIDYNTRGTDGKTYLIDPLKFIATDIGELNGLDSLHTVLAKRAALFYLAPKFEQTVATGGEPQFVGQDGKAVPKDKIPKDFNIEPHGKWIYGNSDAFKPESAKLALATSISQVEGISLEEAQKRINDDQIQAVRMIEYLNNNNELKKDLPKTLQDFEMDNIYKAALSNIDSTILGELESNLGTNIVANTATTVTAALAFSLLTRKSVLAPVTNQSLQEASLNLASRMALTTAAAGATRWGSMYMMTGEHGTFESHMWNTVGSVGLAIIAPKMISSKASNKTFRMLPEDHASRAATGIKDAVNFIPGGKRVTDFASSIKHSFNMPEAIANVQHNLNKFAQSLTSETGERATVGQLRAALGEAYEDSFKKSVTLSTDELSKIPVNSKEGRRILKQAGFNSSSSTERYGLSRKAFDNLGDNPTLLDWQDAASKAGLKERSNLTKLVNLDDADLLKPLSSDLAEEIFERAGWEGAKYTGIAQTLRTLEKGKLTNVARLTDELQPKLTPYKGTATEANIGHFKEYFRSQISDGAKMSDEAFEQAFADAFPNLRNVPSNTAFNKAFRYNLKAFDGPGLNSLLKNMDREVANAIRGVSPGIMGTTGQILRGSNNLARTSVRTAWDFASKPKQNIVEPITRTAGVVTNPAKRGEAIAAIGPTLSKAGEVATDVLVAGAAKGRDGLVLAAKKVGRVANYGIDRVKAHRLAPERSTFTDVANAGTANGVHTYAAMNFTYNSTIGMNSLLGKMNPETNKPYTYTEAWAESTLPTFKDKSMSDVAVNAAIDLFFINTMIRTGAAPGPIFSSQNSGRNGILSRVKAAPSYVWNGISAPYNLYNKARYYSINGGVGQETARAATTAGTMLAADWIVREKIFKTIENTANRGWGNLLTWNGYNSQIGIGARERLDNLRTPIQNDVSQVGP